MLQLMKKRLYPERMQTLLECGDFTREFIDEHMIVKGGEWYIEDGWLVGENRNCAADMIITKEYFKADVLVEFDAATVLPATRDINVTIHGSWNADENCRGNGYVFGVEGFWEGYVGFERSPDYRFLILSDLFNFEPGRSYHITVGNISNTFFLFIDGRLAFQITDPNPQDVNEYGFVGFEAFCTRVKYKNLSIKRLTFEDDWKTYQPEF